MINEIDKRSIKKDLQMIKRSCSIIRMLSPGLIELSLLRSLFKAFIPYISIYMSAVIIDELMQNRNIKLLVYYVVVTIGGTLLMTLISDLISRKVNIMDGMFEARFQDFLNDKKLSMNFSKLEDPKCTELREKILDNMFGGFGGINTVVSLITSIAEDSISVIIAVIVTYGAIMAIPAAAINTMGIVNSGWFSLLLIVAMTVCIIFTVKNSKMVNKKVFELYQVGTVVNGCLGYYHDIYLEDDQAGKDVRIFDQRKLIIDEVLNKGRLPWLKTINGKYSLYQKYFSINSVISALIGGFIYIFIGLKALSGTISLGSVTKTYAAIARLVSSVGNLSVSLSQIRSNNNYLELLYEFIDLPDEMNDGKPEGFIICGGTI